MGDHASALIGQFAATPLNAIGELVDRSDGACRVRLDFGDIEAKRAASCLLEPQPGDRVLVAGPRADALYVIAVLERGAAAAARIDLGGDAELAVGGRLRISAEGGIAVHTAAELTASGAALQLSARRGVALIDQLSVFGREWSASLGKLKLIGNLFETFADRVVQFAKDSLRVVEGSDQVRSGCIDYRAEQSLTLRGSEVVATATELVKVDGRQIHIG